MTDKTIEPGVGEKESDAKEAFEKSADGSALLSQLLTTLKAMDARMKVMEKALPPRDAQFQQGKQPKDIDHNATKEEEDNFPSEDATVKPQKVQIRSDPAYMPKGEKPEDAAVGLLAKALGNPDVKKALEQHVVELVGAHTPQLPPIYKSVAEKKSIGAFVDDWLQKHRIGEGPRGSPENYSGGYRFHDDESPALRSLYKGMALQTRAPEHPMFKGVIR